MHSKVLHSLQLIVTWSDMNWLHSKLTLTTTRAISFVILGSARISHMLVIKRHGFQWTGHVCVAPSPGVRASLQTQSCQVYMWAIALPRVNPLASSGKHTCSRMRSCMDCSCASRFSPVVSILRSIRSFRSVLYCSLILRTSSTRCAWKHRLTASASQRRQTINDYHSILNFYTKITCAA